MQRLMLFGIKESLRDELQGSLAHGAPMLSRLDVVLKRAVAHKFGIEATISRMVDVLIEDAVEIRRHFMSLLCRVDIDCDLR